MSAPGRGTCPSCRDQNGHAGDAVALAHCAYRQATTAAIRDHAQTLGADPLAAADLIAHLRGPLGDAEAYSTARYVLDLGWRPVVGAVS